MSVSIFYRAERATPVTGDELDRIHTAVASMSVDDMIEGFLAGSPPDGSGEGLNWESFTMYEPSEGSDVVFEGSTKLPDNTDDAMWIGVQRWCALLTTIRKIIPDAQWAVFVQDHPITWNETKQYFDPNQ